MNEVEKYLTELSEISGMSLEETVSFAKALVAELEVRNGDDLERAITVRRLLAVLTIQPAVYSGVG